MRVRILKDERGHAMLEFGVASALLLRLRNEAKGTIFLEVAEPNSAAISLYEHHGWVSTGIRKGYYQNGMINAIVMQKRP